MRNEEWVLAYPGTALTLGNPASEAFFLSAPEVGDVEILSDDAPRAREDGVAFGADYRGSRTISFELGITGDTEEEALYKAGRLARAWRADSIRKKAGALATLTVKSPGRERLAYGRPRRIALSNAFQGQGYISAVADFACADDVFYGNVDNTASLTFVPPSSGGFLSPVSSPILTTRPTLTPGLVTIGGDVAAWPVMRIRGPITNPTIQVTHEWDLSLNLSIPSGDVIVLDSRPWRRSVTRERDGASFAGALTRTSRLSRASLDPGRYEIALRGTDPTGLSSLRFSWRTSHSSLGAELNTNLDTITPEGR